MINANPHSSKIWVQLRRAIIPEELTYDPQYLKKRGLPITGVKEYDSVLSNKKIEVYIPIIKMVEYYNNGIPIEITNREEMINIHRDIELYLNEWRDHIKYSINNDITKYKDLLLSLEKFSKAIYDRATSQEVIRQKIENISIGMKSTIQERKEIEEIKHQVKPDYDGILSLVKNKKPLNRY